VTDSNLVFVRRKGMTRRLDLQKLPRYDFPQYGQPQSIGPNTFRIRFDHNTLGIIRAYFGTFREAQELANYFAGGAPASDWQRGVNMLPSDNIYAKAAMGANQTFKERGWGVRIAAVRMLAPGELEVALVVQTAGPGHLHAALDALPGPSEVLEPVAATLRPFGHDVDPQYFAESDWPAVAAPRPGATTTDHAAHPAHPRPAAISSGCPAAVTPVVSAPH